jgi:hypothetical protein
VESEDSGKHDRRDFPLKPHNKGLLVFQSSGSIQGLAEMNNKEIQHYKAAAFDLVSKVQELRRQRLELDDRVAALFRQGRANGIDRRSIKEVLAELHDEPATAESVWQRYSQKIGLTDADIADDNPLDHILDAQTGI